MVVSRGGRRRLFFALWCDEGCREGLLAATRGAPWRDGWSGACGQGKAVPPADWHVTLCFLGGVEERDLQRLLAGASALRLPAFTLHFERLRYWAEAGVIAALADCPPAAVELAAALHALSRGLGLLPDDKPLRPHITLVRGLRGARWDGPRETALDLVLPAVRFELAQSREDVVAPAARYASLGAWPLGA